MSQTRYSFRNSAEACRDTLEGIPLLEPKPVKRDETFGQTDPYLHVALELLVNFQELSRQRSADDLYWKGVRHGFEVIARGVNRCTEAYLAHCALGNQEPDTSQHLQALHNPKTIGYFLLMASTRESKNEILEDRLALRSDPKDSDFTEFVYIKGDKPYFRPRPDLWSAAKIDAIKASEAQDGAVLASQPPDVCAARRFIPMIWHSTVEACYQAELFDFTER